MRNQPWAAEEIEQQPDLVIANPAEMKGKWSVVFGNNQPLHLEIGMGKGQFIAGMATRHPQINYIGLELQTSVLGFAVRKIKEYELANLRLLNEHGQELLDFFNPGEIARIYLNFSDPWPKTRHAKRRLTHARYLKLYHQLLGPKGEIHFKTDNEGLFEYSLNSFADYGCRLRRITFDLHHSDFEGNVMTEYEQKFAEKGMKIFRCEAILPDQADK